MKLFYFGELGFFSTGIWPYLELEMRNYKDLVLDIITLPDIAELLKTIYGDRINITETIYTDIRDHFYSADPKIVSLIQKYSDYYCLKKYVDDIAKKYNIPSNQQPIYFFGIIPPKNLMIMSGLAPVPESILFFPRFRINNCEQHRNAPEWLIPIIVNYISSTSLPYNIIGHPNEIRNSDIIDTTKYLNGLSKMIPYFNSAKLFISCDSGLVDFAKLCGCKRILIVSDDGIFKSYHNFTVENSKTFFVCWHNKYKIYQTITGLLSE